MNAQGRKELDAIIETNGTESWYTPELFERDIRARLPAELEVLAPPPTEKANYNCFIYALELASDTEILRDSSGFIYSAFIQKLLEQKLLVKTAAPVAGDLVFHQDLVNYPNEITHAGVLQADGTVISKWAWGPLLRHALMSVPASYGDTIWYVKSVSREDARDWYWKFKSFNTKPI